MNIKSDGKIFQFRSFRAAVIFESRCTALKQSRDFWNTIRCRWIFESSINNRFMTKQHKFIECMVTKANWRSHQYVYWMGFLMITVRIIGKDHLYIIEVLVFYSKCKKTSFDKYLLELENFIKCVFITLLCYGPLW